MEPKISVIMACYAGDRLNTLKEAVDSINNQTIPYHEFIIIADGPISNSIEEYLNEIKNRNSQLKLIKLDENKGAGYARNYGMKLSKGDYIAIMDADDISIPTRFERQFKALKHNNVDAVWAWQEEFYDDSGKFAGIKRSSETHDEIVKELKFRCLLPDPTTFMKRECFEKTGGYGEFRNVNIDHKFFVNMVLNGFKLYCLPEILIKVRVSSLQRKRRGGWNSLKQDMVLRGWMKQSGFINFFEYIKSVVAYAIFRSIPNFLRDALYQRFLRD